MSGENLSCRICFEEENIQEAKRTSHGILISPCGCIGNNGALHARCLADWIGHSKKVSCEICGVPFNASFYDNDNDKLIVQNAIANATRQTRQTQHEPRNSGPIFRLMFTQEIEQISDDDLNEMVELILKLASLVSFFMIIFMINRIRFGLNNKNKTHSNNILLTCILVLVTCLYVTSNVNLTTIV